MHVVHNYSGYNRDGTSVYKLLYFIYGYCIDSLLSSLKGEAVPLHKKIPMAIYLPGGYYLPVLVYTRSVSCL